MGRLHQGFLVKRPIRGHVLSQPRERFFVLVDDALEWYESDAIGSVPKGYLPLDGAALQRTTTGEAPSLTLTRGDEVLVLWSGNKGEGDDDLEEWEEALRLQIKQIKQRGAGASTLAPLERPVAGTSPTEATDNSASPKNRRSVDSSLVGRGRGRRRADRICAAGWKRGRQSCCHAVRLQLVLTWRSNCASALAPASTLLPRR